jgi:hypothetical protein
MNMAYHILTISKRVVKVDVTNKEESLELLQGHWFTREKPVSEREAYNSIILSPEEVSEMCETGKIPDHIYDQMLEKFWNKDLNRV